MTDHPDRAGVEREDSSDGSELAGDPASGTGTPALREGHPDSPPGAAPSGDMARAGQEAGSAEAGRAGAAAAAGKRAPTRASAAWFATGAALVILVGLIILILQNQTVVEIKYLWLSGSIPLGTALLIAAIAGASVVMMIGVVRVTQLRIDARRARKAGAAPKG